MCVRHHILVYHYCLATRPCEHFARDMKDSCNKDKRAWHSAWMEKLDKAHAVYVAKEAYTSYDMSVGIAKCGRARILAGFASIPLLETMKPKSFLAGTRMTPRMSVGAASMKASGLWAPASGANEGIFPSPCTQGSLPSQPQPSRSWLVLDSLCPWRRHLVGINHLGLHPLDILYTSLTHGDHQERTGSTAYVMPSAMEIYEAGIHFKVSDTDSLLDVHFEHGVLSMPAIRVDDRTEKKFLNLMAFERLHPGAGNDVTAYVIFMDNIISSAKDVALLRSKNIIECGLGSDEEVAKLLNNTLNKGGVMSPSSRLHDVQRRVKAHCRMRWNRWRANFFQRYLRNPWVFISLVAAVVLLVATLLQTVYTVLPFYSNT
ncbi:unnamed protein product [Triticum turgidum subsp. durum]|uniref:Uncharacterized protein n=1 Tax=Triticum turgidum subsp. durum TaxID=4567 RepID=A0A9R1BQX9_TRITD|nr:unnamed protein product [Triticum turgidum subsp. durum]